MICTYPAFQPTLTAPGLERFGLTLEYSDPCKILRHAVHSYLQITEDRATPYPVIPDGTQAVFISPHGLQLSGAQSRVCDVQILQPGSYFGIRFTANGGHFDRGIIEGVLNIRPDHWFFDCHFKGDPVMPGCLGLDALWQLVGVFLGWSGLPGRGRALGVGKVKFSGQVFPDAGSIQYRLDIKRVFSKPMSLGVADGVVIHNEQVIYQANDLKVGLIP